MRGVGEPVVGVNDPDAAAPHQTDEAKRLGHHERSVGAEAPALEGSLLRRRLEGNAFRPKQLRHVALGPMENDQGAITVPVEVLDQLCGGPMTATDQVTRERKADHRAGRPRSM